MNRDDIIRMAREAGIPETANEGVFIANSDDLGRLIAAEREACAKLAEERWLDKANCTEEEMYELQKKSIAAAIRARGQE